MISFTVPGVPQPQGSKRAVRGRLIDANATRLKPWRAAVASAAWDAMHDAGLERTLEPVRLGAVFTFARPLAHYRRDKTIRPNAPIFVATTPDLDKLLRALCDGITDGGVWADDRQVVSLDALKVYGPHPSVEVIVTALVPEVVWDPAWPKAPR